MFYIVKCEEGINSVLNWDLTYVVVFGELRRGTATQAGVL